MTIPNDPIESSTPILTHLRSLALTPSPIPSSNDTGSLFARLKAINRLSNGLAQTHRSLTAEARTRINDTNLGLQNLMYEKRYLEREIEKCRQFAFVYQDVPLHSLYDFMRLAPEDMKSKEVVEDDHRLMLSRLSFELSERQRLEERRKVLVTERDGILAESKKFQSEVDRLSDPFEKLSDMTAKVQQMIHEIVPLPPSPPPDAQSEIEPEPKDDDVAIEVKEDDDEDEDEARRDHSDDAGTPMLKDEAMQE